MMILEDTRQQSGKHDLKHEYFLKNGICFNRHALQCGDYQLPGDASVSVDTKKDIQELIGDIQFKQMSKKDIAKNIEEIWVKYGIISGMPSEMYHLITDDDHDRFAEQEISTYCTERKISERAMAEFQKLYVKRHGFFHRNLVRAKFYGIKFYVLVENKDGVSCIEDVFRWRNIPKYKRKKKDGTNPQNPPMQGQQLAKAMLTMQERYGCVFLFTTPEEAGAKVIELLTRGG